MQLLEPRDSLVPLVAPERAVVRARDAAWLVLRLARAGAASGVVAGLIGGVPYYFAVRDLLPLPWLELASRFVVFVVAGGAVYGAGAALGVHALGWALRARGRAARDVVALVGAALGAAVVGAVPGACGAAYFGSLPYPFLGTAALAVAPFLGAAPMSWQLAVAERDPSRERRSARPALATLAATVLFCALGTVAAASVNDETILAAFRSGASATSGRPDSTLGLAVVGALVGVLLGLALGAQMGVSAALGGGLRWTPEPRQSSKVTTTGA